MSKQLGKKQKHAKGAAQAKGKIKRTIEVEMMEVEAGKKEEVITIHDEEGEEKEVEEDYGPQFIPTEQGAFDFLLEEKPEKFMEAEFHLNRPSRVALNFLQNPHGAVKLYQGDTCTICAVYGPSEVRMAKELPHRAAVDVLYRPKVTGIPVSSQCSGWDSTVEERAIEAKVTKVLESVIFLEDDLGAGFNVILHEVENDGCLFAACINASALALLNAGCCLRFTFAAVTILINESKNELIVDPCTDQINEGFDALITYIFANDGHLLHTSVEGKTSLKMIRTGMRQASEACLEIFSFQKTLQLEECSDFLHAINSKSYLTKKKETDDYDVKMKLEDMKVEEEDQISSCSD